jgi:hypothetical protein
MKEQPYLGNLVADSGRSGLRSTIAGFYFATANDSLGQLKDVAFEQGCYSILSHLSSFNKNMANL